MGNRAYFTITDHNPVSKTFYVHWNGGMDTFAPLCRAVFDNDVTEIEHFMQFFSSLGIRAELASFQNNGALNDLMEENGHYYIDLKRQTLSHMEEGQSIPRWVPNLQEAFESYLNKSILENYRDKTRKEYWDGIMDQAKKFFKRGEK